MASYGFAPYQETQMKAALRLAALGAGLGGIPQGANFGEALVGGLGGALTGRYRAQQAAQEYALKQEQMRADEEDRALRRDYLSAQIEQMRKPSPPEKIPAKQQ